MVDFICAAGASGDLFAETPILGRGPVIKGRLVPELTTARALCRQLRHEQVRRDKKRIAHLIRLNLLSMLGQDGAASQPGSSHSVKRSGTVVRRPDARP